MMRRLRRVGAVSLLLTLVLMAPASGAGRLTTAMASGRAAHLRAVTLWLDWYANSDHAGIYVAKARGFYAQAGLAVQARVPSSAADALQLVAHGSGDMAISF